MSNAQNWNVPRPPAGLAASVDIGWPTLGAMALAENVADVRIGRVALPQLYSVTVHADPYEPEDPKSDWILVLHFMIDEGATAARLALAVASNEAVDISLERVKRRWPMTELQQWAEGLIIADRVSESSTDAEVAEAFDQLQQIFTPRRRRTRTTITDDLLRRVASVYAIEAQKPGGKPTTAVAKGFSTSHSNAARWVSLARKAGHLPPVNVSH